MTSSKSFSRGFLRVLVGLCLCVLKEGTADGDLTHPRDMPRSQAGSCPNYFEEFFQHVARHNGQNSNQTDYDSTFQQWLSISLSSLLQGFSQINDNETQVEPPPAPRFKCGLNPLAQNRTGRVNLVNSTELSRLITERPNASESENRTAENGTAVKVKSSAASVCVVAMFFSTSCRFSAATAPEFNALGRALVGVDVLAFDINLSSGVNSRYGIVAVPTIVLFHNGKLAARYNESKRTLENFVGFIHNLTGLQANKSILVSDEDHEGPISSVAIIGPDCFLWFSNVFLVLCGLGFLQQKVGAAVRARLAAAHEYLAQVWRTGEFYEQVGIADNEHHQQPEPNEEQVQ
ncbi:uncharacterized protein [Diadema antillarum]|uniref:uncharacterized protein n=1 Tax=Diadema antillarum TaxID=105358 RepID=UPI003A88CE18